MKEIPHVNGPEQPDDPTITAETVDAINLSNTKRNYQGPCCLVCCGCFCVLLNDGSTKFGSGSV